MSLTLHVCATLYKMVNQQSSSKQPVEETGKRRLDHIDALRGLIIVIMALDHSRDFFGDVRIRPEDVATTTLPLFFTRWVTHLCAPTFLFLAGVSAWLHGQKLANRNQLSLFLLTRGLWLIFLEFTVIRFGIMFSITMGPMLFIVIAAIGSSMILLALTCFLPRSFVLGLGLTIVCGHNLLDPLRADAMGSFGWIWNLLHQPGYIPWANLAVGYPILPWFGLMAVGYGLGPYLSGPPEKRKIFALRCGLVLLAAFLVLRTINLYGDGSRWSVQYTQATHQNLSESESDPDSGNVEWTRTAYSFLATTKYPPSLLFSLMTLSCSFLLLAGLDQLGSSNWLVRFFLVYGRVPLFFYILHWYLLHLGAWLLYWIFKGVIISPMHIDIVEEVPPEYGFNGPGWLIQVYLGWIVVLAILYPLCRWYGNFKRRATSKFWSYL